MTSRNAAKITQNFSGIFPKEKNIFASFRSFLFKQGPDLTNGSH